MKFNAIIPGDRNEIKKIIKTAIQNGYDISTEDQESVFEILQYGTEVTTFDEASDQYDSLYNLNNLETMFNEYHLKNINKLDSDLKKFKSLIFFKSIDETSEIAYPLIMLMEMINIYKSERVNENEN